MHHSFLTKVKSHLASAAIAECEAVLLQQQSHSDASWASGSPTQAAGIAALPAGLMMQQSA
jgi:hypothetical protein